MRRSAIMFISELSILSVIRITTIYGNTYRIRYYQPLHYYRYTTYCSTPATPDPSG